MVSTGLLVIRLVVGLTVAAHGAQKLFGWWGGPGLSGFSAWLGQLGVPQERPSAVIAALAEFVGGLLVVLGLFTPIAALAVAGDMLVAILAVHMTQGFWNANSGYEFPLVVLASMVGISLTGPGRLALDSLLGVSPPEPLTWAVTAIVVLLGSLAVILASRVRRSAPSPG
jgi:putative oxidoreductase